MLVYVQKTPDCRGLKLHLLIFFQTHTTASLIALQYHIHKENLVCLEKQSVYAPFIQLASHMLNSIKIIFSFQLDKIQAHNCQIIYQMPICLSIYPYLCIFISYIYLIFGLSVYLSTYSLYICKTM